MVAGGLTFAVPGMEPAYADHNPHLRVSAEGLSPGNEIASTNIVEVIVIDDLTDESDKRPIVEVDGTLLTVYFFNGGWYGYFADDNIKDSGLAPIADGDTEPTQPVLNGLVGSHPDFGDAFTPADDTLLNTFDLDGTFDVVYKRSNGDETVTLDLDNPNSSVSLDRTTYPRNTGVVITIDDMALNVSPTSEDKWWFATGKDPVYGNSDLGRLLAATVIRDNAYKAADMAGNATLKGAVMPSDAVAAAEREYNAEIGRINKYIEDNDFIPDSVTTELNTQKALALAMFDRVRGLDPHEDTNSNAPVAVITSVTQPDTPDGTYDTATPEIPDGFVGNAQLEYEQIVGRDTDATVAATPDTPPSDGDITDTIRQDPEYMGDAALQRLIDRASADTAYTAALAIDPPIDADADLDDYTGIDDYFESFDITDRNELLECVGTECAIIDGTTWVMFAETGSNEPTFDNTANDIANLKTADDAQRGLSFSIEYDNTITPGIGYATTNIVIDAGDVWNSGVEAKVTLTDSDANTNSLIEDDLEITNPEQKIPTITVGTPFTLAEVESVMLTPGDVLVPATNEADPKKSITRTVTDYSNILVLGTTASYLPDDLGTTGNDDDIPAMLTLELGDWSDVNDFLPQNAVTFKGVHMLNYDVSDLRNAASISLKIGSTVYPVVRAVDSDGRDTVILTGANFNHVGTVGFANLYDDDNGNIKEFAGQKASLEIAFDDEGKITANETAIVIDVFGFGLENDEDLVNNAIYRLELEEKGDNSSDFEGTLEYIGLNQMNVYANSTYNGIDPFGDSIILISDDDSVSIQYLDLDATGGKTLFTAEAKTPTHTGTVTLDSETYRVSQTVTVTVTDPDLNADSAKRDVYSSYSTNNTHANYGKISATPAPQPLFSIAIDGETWNGGCTGSDGNRMTGLMDTQFSLRETGNDSGEFTGTFAIPSMHCKGNTSTSVTGSDITAEYVDFRDESGSLVTISDTAGIRSSTGSVSLDRSVYPVPFGATGDTKFATYGDDDLLEGELKVYVNIDDADFNTSENGVDHINVPNTDANDPAPLMVHVIRGSNTYPIDHAGNTTTNQIAETGSNTGIFEHEVTISYDEGPNTNDCPTNTDGCILQGDILNVIYRDPSDASGSDNTITDSATFDLRNGVLQSDKTVYVMGTDLLLTLIEPDLNLDSSATETYTLDLIEWDSDAGTVELSDGVFAANPNNLLESGENTGIFHVTITVPSEIDGERLQRGEEITLKYKDAGPSGSDYVGDKNEDISHTVYTSNFGATITLDQRVYTWTDKVFITVTAPDHNIDSDQIDEIGNNGDYPVRISTRGHEIDQYKLVETNSDTGIFTGEVIMTGFAHDADGDGNDDTTPETSPDKSGPTNGKIEVESESGISVSFKFSDGETVSASALVRWNVGEVEWLEASYPATGTGIVRIIDPDMNLNPEAVDNFDVTVWSDSDSGGINLSVAETSDATGIFEGSVVFGVEVDTSGHRLRVSEGDTVTAQYYDNTLPAPFKETERVRVGATTLIGTIVPPLQRAPIADLRAVDSFGNTLDVISVDSQIQLTADLTNGQDKEQDFAYLIQIHDENGVTVSLNWITGTLAPGQSFSPAASWTPTEAGTYKVTAFVWESIENPTALSPTASLSLTVN